MDVKYPISSGLDIVLPYKKHFWIYADIMATIKEIATLGKIVLVGPLNPCIRIIAGFVVFKDK